MAGTALGRPECDTFALRKVGALRLLAKAEALEQSDRLKTNTLLRLGGPLREREAGASKRLLSNVPPIALESDDTKGLNLSSNQLVINSPYKTGLRNYRVIFWEYPLVESPTA